MVESIIFWRQLTINYGIWKIEYPCQIFLFYVIDEMSGCVKPKLGQKLVASGHIRQVFA